MADEIKEKDVHKQVMSEIEAIGATSKENFEEIQKNYKSLQDELDKVDKKIPDNSKIEKLVEDIRTRQDALQEANDQAKAKEAEYKKRFEELELLLKRAKPQRTAEADEKLKKEVDQHILACMASQDRKDRFEYSEDDYIQYKDAFKKFLIKGNQQLGPEEIKRLSVGIDPHGGYTVTPAMSSAITTKLYETDPIRQLSRIETISSDAWEELVDWGQFGYGWVNETGTRSETSTSDFNLKRIPVHEMYANPRTTQQLLDDSGINVENWLGNKVADRFVRAEGAAFITGDGVGKPRGITTYSNGTTYGTVQQVNMGLAANLTFDGFINVKYALIEQYLNRGTWLMNRTTVQAAMKLKNGFGDPLWLPSMSSTTPESILGLPVRMSTTMPTIAANALAVALADWKEAYVIVDRLGISVLRDPYTTKGQIEFYTRRRVGGDLINFDAIKIGKISA